jgi:nicotinamide riboside transporter PnuC
VSIGRIRYLKADHPVHFFNAFHTVPWWNWALQFAGLFTAYVGAELNARMRIGGFLLWLVSNITLAVLHAITGLWLLLVLDVLFFRVNVLGTVRWARERPETAPLFLHRLLGINAASARRPAQGS